MLLIDGVKYELWTPELEIEEFEPIIKEHAEDIFGKPSLYLDIKTRLEPEFSPKTVPDGFVIHYGQLPHWRIVEVELSKHPLHEHIVSQVGKFINGIGDLSTQRKVADAIDSEIRKRDVDLLKLRKAIEPMEVYRFLSNLVSEPPILTIVIEEETPQLKQALSILRYPQIEVVEFRTFTGEGVGLAVHAHLFEPSYPLYTVVPPVDGLVIDITPGLREYHSFDIPHSKQSFFPAHLIPFELETDIGIIETNVAGNERGYWIQRNLKKWWNQHPEIKVGDKVVFRAIEPMKRYRLEILKE